MTQRRSALPVYGSLIASAVGLSCCGQILGLGGLHDRVQDGGESAEGGESGGVQDTGEPHDSMSESAADGSGSSAGADSGSSQDADAAASSGNDAGDAGEGGDGSGCTPAACATDLCLNGACWGSTTAGTSCMTSGRGVTDCAATSCCTSVEVPGGTYYRTYTNMGAGPTSEADPATVSGFRLDKYEVTVGRFRRFVSAVAPADGGGWLPAAGSGKHTHLNEGRGLVVAGTGGYEPGWQASDDGNISPLDSNLACIGYATWTPVAGANEDLPIACVNWYEAYAFCIWDGGFLPSEAEWEYAAAGGSQQREYPWGSNDPGNGSQLAIYGCHYPANDAGSCLIAPVGTATAPGVWGQLDLAGNVREWNLDWYAAYVSPCTDCAYLTTGLDGRMFRGGDFSDTTTSSLVPAYRNGMTALAATTRTGFLGFRCARTP